MRYLHCRLEPVHDEDEPVQVEEDIRIEILDKNFDCVCLATKNLDISCLRRALFYEPLTYNNQL